MGHALMHGPSCRLIGVVLVLAALASVRLAAAWNDNLIAHWTCDESSDGSVQVDRGDSHTNNLDLTDNNTTAASATAIFGNSCDFEASNTESLSRADGTELSMGAEQSFTLAAWVRLETQTANKPVFGKFNATGNQREYLLDYENASDRFRFRVSADGSSTLVGVTATNAGGVENATWYLVIAWHDATANELDISVNDSAETATSHSTGVFDGTAGFYLGNFDGGTAPMDGLLDSVSVWKRVLTSDERTALYNGGAGLNYPFPSSVSHRRLMLMGVGR